METKRHPSAPRRPTFLQVDAPAAENQRDELLRGLRDEKPWIAPKYFYDALGSRLFEAICELPEYYLTRVEREIMDAHRPQIAAAIGYGCTLIDLGAGNCEKAERLFDLLRPAQYVAIDISADFLRIKLEALQDQHPQLDIVGLGMDFSRRLTLPAMVRREKRLFFYPGSSIGNFTPEEAGQFLGRIRAEGGEEGQLLLGVDLAKDKAVLEAAYDDTLGVTASFNQNILNNVNRILGSDFDVRDWRHVAFFNERESRIEMHLEAKREVLVRLPDGPRAFRAGDRVHTENSYKLGAESLRQVFAASGLVQTTALRDARDRFLVSLSRPGLPRPAYRAI